MKSTMLAAQSGSGLNTQDSELSGGGDFNSLSVGYIFTPIDEYCIKRERERKADESLQQGEKYSKASGTKQPHSSS